MAGRRDPLVITLMCTVWLLPPSLSTEDNKNNVLSWNTIPLPPSTPPELYALSVNLTGESYTPYPKTSSYILREKLLEEDRAYDVKVLTSDHQVSIYLLEGDVKRLVFPLGVLGPLIFTVTPCAHPLSWTLFLRPYSLVSAASSSASHGVVTLSPPPGELNYESSLSGSSVQSNAVKRVRRITGSASDTSNFTNNNTSSVLHSLDQKYKYSQPMFRTMSDTNVIKEGHQEDRDENKYNSRRVADNIKDGSDAQNGTSKEGKDGTEDLRRTFDRDIDREKKEVLIEQYEGHDPRQYRDRAAVPGLYVLQLKEQGGATHVHVHVSSQWLPAPPTAHITVTRTPTPLGKAVTLRWASSGRSGYCLAVSEGRPFPSLCAAASAASDVGVDPATHKPAHHRQRHRKGRRRLLVALGCTDRPWYSLPHPPRRRLHVAVWAAGRAGPPLGRGLIPATPKRKVPRLKPGSMVKLVPSATGKVKAKLRVRQGWHLLHVMAVACGAKVRLRVESQTGELLASALGGIGALHLAIRSPSPEALILTLKIIPPGAANKVLLAAAHFARDLPLPRLPRNSRVRVGKITCTSATFRWSAAPGSQAYCILLQEDSSGKVWRTRPPLQCGWEAALRRARHYAARWCGPPTPAGRHRHAITTLTPATTYTATVLVRHPATGHTLSFTPVHFTTRHTCHT